MPNDGMTDKIRDCFERSIDAEMTVAEVAECVGLPQEVVRSTLPRLVTQGELTRVKRGVYAYPAHTNGDAPAPAGEKPMRAKDPRPPEAAWEIVHEWADGDMVLAAGDRAYLCRRIR